MSEYLMIAAMGSGGILFALGGTGFKWARRFVLPVALGTIAFFGGIIWWRCLAYWFTQTGTLHLGYGEKLPCWRKAATAVAYTLPSLFLGFTFWQIVFPAVFLVLFKLSNFKPTANMFVWKICEFTYGVCLGVIVAHIIK